MGWGYGVFGVTDLMRMVRSSAGDHHRRLCGRRLNFLRAAQLYSGFLDVDQIRATIVAHCPQHENATELPGPFLHEWADSHAFRCSAKQRGTKNADVRS